MFLFRLNTGYYYLYFNDSTGKRTKISTRVKTKSEANLFLQNFNLERHLNKSRGEDKTLSQFIELYLPHSKANFAPTTHYLHELALLQLQDFLGDIPMRDITVQQIDSYKAYLITKKKPIKPISANSVLSKLKSMFKTAKRWNIITSNPIDEIKPYFVPDAIPAFFTTTDFKILLTHITDENVSDFCKIGFLTGMRLSEISSLEWIDIDFNSRTILIRSKEGFTTKGGKNRSIPMNDDVYKILQNRKAKITTETKLIFYCDGRKYFKDFVTHKFKKYVIKSGLDKTLHFHSLRHSFCSNLVKKGVSLYQVQKLAGHRKPITTQKYSHLVPEEMHNVVNVLTLGD